MTLPVGTTVLLHGPWTIGPNDMTPDEFVARKGTEVEVLGLVDPATYDADEVGPMYRVRFTSDDRVIEAWPEEVE